MGRSVVVFALLAGCISRIPFDHDSASVDGGDGGDPTGDGAGADGGWSGDGGGTDGDADGDGVADEDDCQPEDATIFPGADERCNETDDDCDGRIDEDAVDAVSWYLDADGDLFGDPAHATVACEGSEGEVSNGLDCDDSDPDVNPGVVEVCDGVDSDCVDDGDLGAVSIGEAGFASLQAAFDGASTDDVINVCPGTYRVNLDAYTRVSVTASGAVSETVLDGGGAGPVVTLHGIGIALTGLTLTGGAGGAIDATSNGGGDVILHGCLVQGNEATSGAGVTMGNGRLLADTTEFVSNSATLNGGAIYLARSASGELSDCTLSDNEASSGGAIYTEGSLTIEDCLVEGNAASDAGGAVYAAADLTLSGDTVLRGNSATSGGGVYAADSDSSADATVVIQDNTATDEGAGVFLSASSLAAASWTGGTITGNVSDSYAGGICVDAADDGSALVEGVEVLDNAADFSGGGMWLAGPVEVSDSTVTANEARFGGGLSVNYTDLVLIDGVTIDSNTAECGGAFDLYEGSAMVSGSTIIENLASSAGGAVCLTSGTTLESVASDWGEDSTDNDPDDVFIDYGTTASYSFGSDESFTCDGDLVLCE